MMNKLMAMKRIFIRMIEISLALHGFLHIFEFITAMYEEAYITATLAAFGSITMLLGALFLENGHHPHTIHHDKWRDTHENK